MCFPVHFLLYTSRNNNPYMHLASARWQRLRSSSSAFRNDCRLETLPERRLSPTVTFAAIICTCTNYHRASVLTRSFYLHSVRSGSFVKSAHICFRMNNSICTCTTPCVVFLYLHHSMCALQVHLPELLETMKELKYERQQALDEL